MESTFVAVMEPWRDKAAVQALRRVDVHAGDGSVLGDTEVALEITLPDGRRDLLLMRDAEKVAVQPEVTFGDPTVKSDSELAWMRLSGDGHVERAAVGKGTRCSVGAFALQADASRQFAEFNTN